MGRTGPIRYFRPLLAIMSPWMYVFVYCMIHVDVCICILYDTRGYSRFSKTNNEGSQHSGVRGPREGEGRTRTECLSPRLSLLSPNCSQGGIAQFRQWSAIICHDALDARPLRPRPKIRHRLLPSNSPARCTWRTLNALHTVHAGERMKRTVQ